MTAYEETIEQLKYKCRGYEIQLNEMKEEIAELNRTVERLIDRAEQEDGVNCL
jgi:prefoldin subunit 5